MIYVIVGPTASGKTGAAHVIAETKNAPIINADAFQIYKDMNIGTNKVSPDDPFYSRYYLLDIVSPDLSYSVRDYQKVFRETLESLNREYEDIVIVGGSGLYIRASLYDYTFPDEIETETYDALSNQEIYDILKEKDPECLETIHINNRKRLVRALNIVEHGEKLKSENIKSQNHTLYDPYLEVRFLFINPERKALYQAIDDRVDIMFDKGLVNEVNELLSKYQLSITAREAIGYKEVIDYINGAASLEDVKEVIKQRTRNYAKRQVTFFKHQLPCQEYESAQALIEDVITNG